MSGGIILPTPAALALTEGTSGTVSVFFNGFGSVVNLVTSGTYYNINAISLTPGTYSVTGIYGLSGSGGSSSATLSLTSAAGASSWPSQSVSLGANGGLITAVIKVTTTTTVYLNEESTISGYSGQGIIVATKIL